MARTKRVGHKTVLKGSGSSNPAQQEEEHIEVDSYYTPEQQVARFSEYLTRVSTSPRYIDTVWFITQGFEFPSLLDTQGLLKFMELQGDIYPGLVKEFYANLQFKDSEYVSMIKGVKFSLSKDLFRDVGCLPSDGVKIGDCDDSWNNFDANTMYISCLRHHDMYVEAAPKRAGHLTIEDRILHYLIVYILNPRLRNLAQPTVKDLQLMYVIKNEIMFDWYSEILKHMHLITKKKKGTKVLPLGYSIFISRIVNHLGIDTSTEATLPITPQDHLIDKGKLQKMNMTMTPRGEWVHESEVMQEVDEMQIDSGNEEDEQPHHEDEGMQGPHAAEIPADIPPFGLAHLDAMEQRLSAQMIGLVQGLGDQMAARMDNLQREFQDALRLQTEILRAEYYRMHFDDNNPPAPDQPQNP